MKQWIRSIGMLCVVCLLCFGCGGGGGSHGGAGPEEPTTVTGAAVKGMVKGGTVNVYACVDGQKSTLLGTTTTSSTDGTYKIDLGTYTGPVLIEVTGGTYHDEATGVDLPLSGTLRAALGNAYGGVTAAVTPLTELAVRKIGASGTLFLPDVIEDTNMLISQLLGGDGTNDRITQLIPVDASSDAAASASQAAKEYGLLLAAISQLAKDRGVDVTEVIDDLADDLTDNVLDDTGAELVTALNDFMVTTNNKTGLTAADVADTIGKNITDPLTPTGDLATAKELLSALLQDPSNTNYNNFMTYINQFTPTSKESYLFKAMGELFALYSNSDIGAILQAVNVTDMSQIKAGLSIDQIKALALIAANNTDVDKVLAGAIARLDAADAQLAQAEGVKTSISLTGFDTVYLDDIDVKTLRTFVAFFKAGLTVAQAIDLTVATWQVDLPGSNIYSPDKVDIRDLLHNEDYEDLWDSLNGDLYYNEDEDKNDNGIDDDQDVWLSFMDKNEKFLTYRSDATTKLAEFKTLYATAVSRYDAVMDALSALGSDGRNKRWQNAFNISSDCDFYEMKLVQDHTLPSIQAAFTDAAAGVKLSIDEEVDERIVVIDGYAYDQETTDIYVGTFTPVNGAITISSLLNQTKTLRDLVLADLADENYRMFSENPGNMTLYADNAVRIGWEDPFETFTVPVAAISVTDNSMTDWDAVPVFSDCGTHEIKLARDSSTQNLYIFFHIRDEFPFTLLCPWHTYRDLSLSCIMPGISRGWDSRANAWISLNQWCISGTVQEPTGSRYAIGNDIELTTDGKVFKDTGRVTAGEYQINGANVNAFFTSGSFNWFSWSERQGEGDYYDYETDYSSYVSKKVKLLPEIAAETSASAESAD